MFKLAVFSMLLAVCSAGVVTPVINCGSAGQPLELRITECSGAPPCTITPNRDYTIEGDFVASASSADSKFELTARTTSGQNIPVAEGPLGPITGGQNYTASQTIRISEALSGQTVVAQVRIIAEPSNVVEICIQAGMIVQ